MANTSNVLCVNTTSSTKTFASGKTVGAYSSAVYTLTDAEVTALATDATMQPGLGLIFGTPATTPTAGPSDTTKHWFSKILRVGSNPGV